MDDLPAPPGLDPEVPSAARMYDYYLGGAANFAADRTAADQLIAQVRDVTLIARTNRAFLGRAVRWLADQGVDQFLDLGSGIPTVGNVHEVARRTNPQARVVYVDHDRTAVEHARHLLADDPHATALHADLRDSDHLRYQVTAEGVLDLGRRVALLACAVLHFLPDTDRPAAILAAYRRHLAAGSWLVISHGTADQRPTRDVQAGLDTYAHTATPVTPRTHAHVVELFGDSRLVEPGVVWAPLWHPDPGGEAVDAPERSSTWAGVAHLP
jgi:SAM-dependent methyltransferase